MSRIFYTAYMAELKAIQKFHSGAPDLCVSCGRPSSEHGGGISINDRVIHHDHYKRCVTCGAPRQPIGRQCHYCKEIV